MDEVRACPEVLFFSLDKFSCGGALFLEVVVYCILGVCGVSKLYSGRGVDGPLELENQGKYFGHKMCVANVRVIF